MRFFWLSLFLVVQMSAQEVLFEGKIFDTRTGEPIPYVNLSFLNTLKGTSTDEEGHFFMDIPKYYLENQVHISSLGYKDTIIVAKRIFDSKNIGLQEASYELDEVVVSKNLGGSDILNPIGSYSVTSGFSSSSTPWVLALYFPNIGAQEKFVEKISVFVQKNPSFKNPTSKFRIRIYDVHPVSKEPNHDILKKSLVLESQSEEDLVSIDLSAVNIKIPQEGIFIGLEWLFVPNNWYRSISEHPITKKKEIEDRFAPTFGGVYSKNQNLRTMVYGMGKWTDFTTKSKDHMKNFIPAISLKIKKGKVQNY